MKTDHYEYTILNHFLPYLINADATGLTDEEFDLIQEWRIEQIKLARKVFPTLKSAHWDYAECQNWAKCEITGYFGDVADVQLVILYE